MNRSPLIRRALRSTAVALVALLCLSACTGDDGVDGAKYEIAGGDPSGVYYNYGQHLAEAVQRELGLDTQVVRTQGSVENLQLVGSGKALLGFAQGDTAVDAVLGEGRFADPLPVRAVARVYDEYVHVVVPADSEVRKISDLAGRRVSLGAENSGVQVIATRMLDAAGVGLGDVTNLGFGLDQSIEAMQLGEIEAFFWVGGLPTPGIVRLEKTMPIRLLSIDAALVERVNEGHAGVYQLADFPVGFYGLEGATVTMTVPNYLIAAASAPDDVVYNVLRVLFDVRTSIARSVPAAAYLDRRQAIFTGPIELHEGAAKYYVDTRR